ncbi:Ig-like domain repeat protein [Cellulomonas sp.]|uniref:Ig-like domain repeat protein n=1 Tax=Cellulomonas sp. TaxID=40001 RepID=UPI002588AA97|nr:Ig-like domain repeat protein [Cellulomonas sp.]MCR6688216.1 Ig-like domain-containing protein [Cellulomonas sp.]
MYLTRTRRRLATAAVLAASVLPTAALVPAQAASTAGVISGEVIWPADVRATMGYAYLYEQGAVGMTPLHEMLTSESGAVSFTGLDPAKRYVVQLHWPCTDAATGFYDGQGTLAPSSTEAVGVAPGGAPLEFVPVAQTTTYVTALGPSEMSGERMRLREPGTGAVLAQTCQAGSGPTHKTWYLGGVAVGTPAMVELAAGGVSRYALGADRAYSTDISRAGTVPGGTTVRTYREGVEAVELPVLNGTARVGAWLGVSSGTWAPTGGELSYAWLRDGVPIPGATGPSYQLVQADTGAQVSARVTSALPDLGLGVETTAPTARVWGPAAVSTAPPRIVGTAAVGTQLAATTGTWDVTGLTFQYQWSRAGVPISGATSSRYTVTTADVGKSLAVRVTASAAYRPKGLATSAATSTVPKVTPVVTTKLVAAKVKAGTRAKAVVTVKAAGMTAPTGKVTVTVGSKKAIVTLGASAKGKVTVTLPAMPRGSYKVKAAFAPSTTAAAVLKPASSAAVTLRVV